MLARTKRIGKSLLDRSYPLARTFHYLHGGYYRLAFALSGRKDRSLLLVLKLERIEVAAPAALADFLGLKDFKLKRANIARDKTYAEPYQEFIDRITLPVSYLDRMYGARYAQTFYSSAELLPFRARWQRSPSAEKR